jgi:hypothetical protein
VSNLYQNYQKKGDKGKTCRLFCILDIKKHNNHWRVVVPWTCLKVLGSFDIK